MHLRRAMLLFAIVLGLAALATSVSRPREERSAGGDQPQTAAPPPSPAAGAREPARLRFSTSQPRRRRGLATGRQAVVTVATDRAGQVQLEGLGLSAPADPLTPARFDVLADRPTTARVRFTPAGASEQQPAGTLAIGESAALGR